MPRVCFSEDFDWQANSHAVIAYKAGKTYPVIQRCADEAIAAGKATAANRSEKSE